MELQCLECNLLTSPKQKHNKKKTTLEQSAIRSRSSVPKPLDAVGVLPRGRNQMTNPGKSTADSLVIIDFCTHTSKNCESSHDLKSFENNGWKYKTVQPIHGISDY